MIFILTPLLGVIMIIILTVPDPCGNDYDYRSHRARTSAAMPLCVKAHIPEIPGL